jgi:iron complex transport system substrate-binding protein
MDKLPKGKNIMEFAKGLIIEDYKTFAIVKVLKPWPTSKDTLVYVLAKKGAIIPEIYAKEKIISVPLKNIIVTSTTNIPCLEAIGVEEKLIGFPGVNFISSSKTRKLIDTGKIVDVGQNEQLNFEKILTLNPDLVVAFGIDNNNATLQNLTKQNVKVLIQADWMENTPLGKAEWIKLYGYLFGKEKLAYKKFDKIERDYLQSLQMVKNLKNKPNVLVGSMYQDNWYVPRGNSWNAHFIESAHANYIFSEIKGVGSETLRFERVFVKGKNADIWITQDYESLNSLVNINPHYKEFLPYKNKKIFTFDKKKGAKDGIVFYELAANRPDLVLKDYIKIIHPNVLPDYQLTFADQIK